MPAYLSLMPKAEAGAVRVLHETMRRRFAQDKKGFSRFRELYEKMAGIRAKWLDFSGDVVRIGARNEISAAEFHLVRDVMRQFMPWRKGPFSIFGLDIDSEWRSDRKWRRLQPVLPDLRGRVIADIGCNNGYYMFRMAAANPAMVLGFEPYVQHYYAFRALNRLAGQDNLRVEPFGVEDIGLFPECFDVIFLMGIIYHRASPVEMLRQIRAALKPGGLLIVESQAIPGDEPVALFPESRYAKVPGTYFIPTAACLQNWLKRTGFSAIELFDSHPMSDLEQRRTDWMTFESYNDFIDPENPRLTVEGYPAPLRVYLRASK
ncbi:MAG: tRNA 5-methoxyuridine(34)/uridine 5-oxyacetic acid(34) synthase CmoB [Deltaproteobacteria bacterium]|nr:tRNA 5-methoxyuridine(34)/uridine 5-oxyacetic acid(34) synthase CmoB [Deltaproteobacteria bacterium]